MKKLVVSLALMMFVALTGITAMAGDWKPDMNAPLANNLPEDAVSLSFGGSKIDIKPIEGGNRFEVSIFNPKLTKAGVDFPYAPDIIRIASGILDASKASGNEKVLSEYIAECRPEKDGKIVFYINNFAKNTDVPVVEHLWGIGKSAESSAVKYLILDPDSPWVSYETNGGKPDIETLAIGIVMCPDGKIFPLKSLDKGKLKCGKHPELADICKK